MGGVSKETDVTPNVRFIRAPWRERLSPKPRQPSVTTHSVPFPGVAKQLWLFAIRADSTRCIGPQQGHGPSWGDRACYCVPLQVIAIVNMLKPGWRQIGDGVECKAPSPGSQGSINVKANVAFMMHGLPPLILPLPPSHLKPCVLLLSRALLIAFKWWNQNSALLYDWRWKRQERGEKKMPLDSSVSNRQ